MFLNRVILIGFTGSEAKHSELPGGRSVTRLSLATTKRHKDGEQWKETTHNGTIASPAELPLILLQTFPKALT